MEPNKFERDVRQKMEQRTIQPSEMAWDRLDAMLSVTEKTKKKPNRTWMYMAASFLALLLVGTLFLNREKENGTNNTNTNSVVTIEKQLEVTTEDKPSIIITTEAIKEKEAVATATPAGTGVKNVSGVTKAPKATVKYYKSTASGIDKEVAANEPVVNEVSTAETVITTPKVTPSKIKVDANSLLASVDAKSSAKPFVNNPVLINPDVKQTSVKVNANSLLSSVEGELDESFRTKVLNTVSKGYNKVKTSVATRNRQ